MTTKDKTIVSTDGRATIIRWRVWGFRCNSITTSWIVQDNRTGHQVTICSLLRDAKEAARRFNANLSPVNAEEI